MISGLTITAQRALGRFDGTQSSVPSAHAHSIAVATLAGLVGHHTDQHADWLPKTAFRHMACDVSPDELLAIHAAERGPGPIDVAIMVHGLFVDEQNWLLGPDPLAAAVQPMFGWAPLLVRYNTGKHISSNGEEVADRIQELADAWGPRLGRVQVFGHSMGGLVARSALGALERRNASVLNHVDRLFLLATPNQGAELERLGHAIEVTLSGALALPRHGRGMFGRRKGTTGPHRAIDPKALVRTSVGDVVDGLAARVGATVSLPVRSARALFRLRSDGIRDVRFGYMQAREWQLEGHTANRLLLSHRRPLPPPDGVTAYAIAGSLLPTRSEEPSRVRSDGVVSVASAAGLGGPFDDLGLAETDRFAEVPMLLHQLVPSSARVRKQLRAWCEEG